MNGGKSQSETSAPRYNRDGMDVVAFVNLRAKRFRAGGTGLWLLVLALAPMPTLAQDGTATDEPVLSVAELARMVFGRDRGARSVALAALAERGEADVVAALIQALRFVPDREGINATLHALTGESEIASWHEWILWQEAHPEIEPYAGFDALKADSMAIIDENFRLFLRPGIAHEIRLEEIVWGGVRKDGIPALVNPTHLEADEAGYLEDDELVFGVEIDGDARAYPLRILDWHEMFNDVIGGVPVALAYCTLCGSGILFETAVAGRSEPFVFGSSGFLYRSNKLMYDRGTNSLWNQFLGQPVVGPLTGSGIELTIRPVVITSWKDWRAGHPHTKVLSLDTGYARDYTPGRPYGDYFASPDLMFPALTPDPRLRPKDYVFALRLGEMEKAWPLAAFDGGRVINDTVGETAVVLIGDAATRTVRAYRREGFTFEAAPDGLGEVVAEGRTWRVEEEALIGAGGERLRRLPGHIAYWFAWSGFRSDAPLFDDPEG